MLHTQSGYLVTCRMGHNKLGYRYDQTQGIRFLQLLTMRLLLIISGESLCERNTNRSGNYSFLPCWRELSDPAVRHTLYISMHNMIEHNHNTSRST